MSADTIVVIPAAGRGVRLGVDTPKLFVEIAPGESILDVILSRIAPHARRAHLVLSPEGLAYFDRIRDTLRRDLVVTASVQSAPLGMGDAVFSAREQWSDARHLVVVWGDQVGLSASTFARTIDLQQRDPQPALTLPLVERESPYVHYRFEADRTLLAVDQAREGDRCPPRGLSDVGLFAMSTAGLWDAWLRYLATPAAHGARTREINLLPFFAHLSQHEGFEVRRVEVLDPDEARGVNTPEELAWHRARHVLSR